MSVCTIFYNDVSKQIDVRSLGLIEVFSHKGYDGANEGVKGRNVFICMCAPSFCSLYVLLLLAWEIYEELVNLQNACKIPLGYVIGFNADCCNSLMGAHNSVASRFKEKFPGKGLSRVLWNNTSLI